MDLANRNVVVTGGASGIGRAMCRAFARQGVRGIVVADLNGDGARTVADELSDQGFPAIAVPTDVTDESQVTALVAASESAFGVVDVFCANAGIVVPGGVELSDDVWQRMWAVNVRPGRASGHAGAGRRVSGAHGIGGRPAYPAGFGPLQRDQACRGGPGRMAVHHPR
jgi:NAD(P)-dependent dehydrogenase (short-subunit alcohol dehydrogenase family)